MNPAPPTQEKTPSARSLNPSSAALGAKAAGGDTSASASATASPQKDTLTPGSHQLRASSRGSERRHSINSSLSKSGIGGTSGKEGKTRRTSFNAQQSQKLSSTIAASAAALSASGQQQQQGAGGDYEKSNAGDASQQQQETSNKPSGLVTTTTAAQQQQQQQQQSQNYYHVYVSDDDGGIEMRQSIQRLFRAIQLRSKYVNMMHGLAETSEKLQPPIQLKFEDGIMVFTNQTTVPVPWETFYEDIVELQTINSDLQICAAANFRLQALEEKFNIHRVLNSNSEDSADPLRRGGGVFGAIQRVDNNVRLSASMSAMHLVRCIQEACEHRSLEVVRYSGSARQTQAQTLQNIMNMMSLDDPRALTVEGLSLHPPSEKRFSRFDPLDPEINRRDGPRELLRAFLTRDTANNGRLYADVVRPVVYGIGSGSGFVGASTSSSQQQQQQGQGQIQQQGGGGNINLSSSMQGGNPSFSSASGASSPPPQVTGSTSSAAVDQSTGTNSLRSFEAAEFSIPVHGASDDEWDSVAKWVIQNKLLTTNGRVMWTIEIPRSSAKRAEFRHEFQQKQLECLFAPLFLATLSPDDPKYSDIATFLNHVGAFVITSDEEARRGEFPKKRRPPRDVPWSENVPDLYFAYYFWANLCSLNAFRLRRGFKTTFQLRAAAGERNTQLDSIFYSYLLCDNISHGVLLGEYPVLQYLFGYHKIGICMSPLSNNAMDIEYIRNPFPTFFRRGLAVTLCSDSPLHHHHHDRALLEEYGTASKIYKLSAVDMAELARMSVILSSFPHETKILWTGEHYSDTTRTCVPQIRLNFREESWGAERYLIFTLLNEGNINVPMMIGGTNNNGNNNKFIPGGGNKQQAHRRTGSGSVGKRGSDSFRLDDSHNRSTVLDDEGGGTLIGDNETAIGSGGLNRSDSLKQPGSEKISDQLNKSQQQTGTGEGDLTPHSATTSRVPKSVAGGPAGGSLASQTLTLHPTFQFQAASNAAEKFSGGSGSGEKGSSGSGLITSVPFPRLQLHGPVERDTHLGVAGGLLHKALDLRQGYIWLSSPEQKIESIERLIKQSSSSEQEGGATVFDKSRTANFDESAWVYRCVNGVFVHHARQNIPRIPHYLPEFGEFAEHINNLQQIVENSVVKSIAFRRLNLLEHKYNLHHAISHSTEAGATESKVSQNRDFYQTTKIDTSVRMESGMTSRQLLNFIIAKAQNSGDDIVSHRSGEEPQTLRQLLKELRINPEHLTVDDLNVQADSPVGGGAMNEQFSQEGRDPLLTLLLKTENEMNGRYFAELTKLTFDQFQRDKFTFAENRLTIYGASENEWDRLSNWFDTHGMACYNNEWMIQFPRIYGHLKKKGLVKDFAHYLTNLFDKPWKVSLHPAEKPRLFHFLNHVSGFDCVGDERGEDVSASLVNLPPPHQWTSEEDPPYNYYMYYIWINIRTLNEFRDMRQFSTYSFRPSCGEGGNKDHLLGGFLLGNAVNYGVNLAEDPSIQYLFYLAQIGVSVSPLSNNTKYLEYLNNPFPALFRRGLNVSLSTDCPLQVHHTQEPLIEEYSVASKVWKLSLTDMCEIARNSVLQSGFSHDFKAKALGKLYFLYSARGNDSKVTHLSDVRVAYRYETYHNEVNLLEGQSNLIFPRAMLKEKEEDILEGYVKKHTASKADAAAKSGIIAASTDEAEISRMRNQRQILSKQLTDAESQLESLKNQNRKLFDSLNEAIAKEAHLEHSKQSIQQMVEAASRRMARSRQVQQQREGMSSPASLGATAAGVSNTNNFTNSPSAGNLVREASNANATFHRSGSTGGGGILGPSSGSQYGSFKVHPGSGGGGSPGISDLPRPSTGLEPKFSNIMATSIGGDSPSGGDVNINNVNNNTSEPVDAAQLRQEQLSRQRVLLEGSEAIFGRDGLFKK